MKTISKLFSFSIFAAVFACLTSAAAFGALYMFQQTDRIAYGVSINGINLSGLTKFQATDIIGKLTRNKLNRNAVLLNFEKKSWQIAPADIELTASPEKAVADAYQICRSGDIITDMTDAVECFSNGKRLSVETSCNKEKLKNILDTIAKKIDCEGKSASCKLTDSNMIIKTKGTVGKRTDTAALTEHLIEPILELRLPRRIEIEPDLEPPAVTDADIKPIDRVLASYTTYFVSGTNRGENIRLAAESLNHLLIKAGTEFSFNKTVGRRTTDAGYLNAPVIIDGRTEDGIGGGVCQVSSTLYNAILLANLTPLERTAHFFPSGYVPSGLDATVADNQLDLRFKNTLNHNIYLITETNGDALTVNILGTASDLGGMDIGIYTRTNEDGGIESWRVYYDHDKEIRRQHLFTDEYDTPKEEPHNEVH